MADNVVLNLGSGGATAAAREISHGGDTAQLQGVFLMGIAGAEGSYTAAAINGDAANGIDVDITRANFTGAVDTAAGATQVGIAALTVRDDALATLTEADGDLSLARVNARGALWVALDATVAQTVTLAAGTATNEVVGDVAHDAVSAGNPLLMGGYASAAVPTDVSGDADCVRAWFLRSGAQAVQPTYGGVLAVAGNGASGTGVQRVTIANDSTGVLATVTNVATIGTSVTPGTSAAHLGKAEDAAHGSGDTGVAVWAVRRDANTSLVDTTGDYAPLQVDATGNLKVAIISGAGSGGTSIADAAAFTRATTSVTPVGGVVETSAPTVTNGNTSVFSLTTGGALRVNVASGGITGAVEDAVASGAAEGILNIAVRDDALATLTPVDGDYTAHRTNARGALWVALDSTAAQTVTLAAGTATNEIVGDVAHDGVAAGNPVLIGARASAAVPTDVSADNDVTELWALRSGALAVQPTFGGVLGVAGNGASGTGVQRVTIANDSTGVLATVASVTNVVAIGTSVTPGTSAGHLGKAEDAAHASGDTGVAVWTVRTDTLAASSGTTGDYEAFHTDSVGALWTRNANEIVDDAAFTPGTSRVQPVGFTADETATDSVDEGDIGAGRMTLDRKQIVANLAHTAGGATSASVVSAASNNATSLKGSAGQVYSVTASNINAAARYLKFYNKATAPAPGSDTPVYVFPLPGNTAGAGITHSFPVGLEFTTGIAWALVAGASATDNTSVSATEHVVSIAYK